jgi:hypothetical protein
MTSDYSLLELVPDVVRTDWLPVSFRDAPTLRTVQVTLTKLLNHTLWNVQVTSGDGQVYLDENVVPRLFASSIEWAVNDLVVRYRVRTNAVRADSALRYDLVDVQYARCYTDHAWCAVCTWFIT